MLKWRIKREVGWDELGEWKYLIEVHGHLVERLKEKFDQMEIREVTPIGRLKVPAGSQDNPTTLHPSEPMSSHHDPCGFPTSEVSGSGEPGTQVNPPHSKRELQAQWGSQEGSRDGVNLNHSPSTSTLVGTQCTGHLHPP